MLLAVTRNALRLRLAKLRRLPPGYLCLRRRYLSSSSEKPIHFDRTRAVLIELPPCPNSRLALQPLHK
jgi:hypothetical protein